MIGAQWYTNRFSAQFRIDHIQAALQANKVSRLFQGLYFLVVIPSLKNKFQEPTRLLAHFQIAIWGFSSSSNHIFISTEKEVFLPFLYRKSSNNLHRKRSFSSFSVKFLAVFSDFSSLQTHTTSQTESASKFHKSRAKAASRRRKG